MKKILVTALQIACAGIPVSVPAESPDNSLPVLIQEREWNGNVCRTYKSGHSLPMDYVPHAVVWFKKYL